MRSLSPSPTGEYARACEYTYIMPSVELKMFLFHCLWYYLGSDGTLNTGTDGSMECNSQIDLLGEYYWVCSFSISKCGLYNF